MQNIYLCTITEIDLDNQRQIDFSSKSSQYSWFDKQNVKIIEGNIAVDTLTPSIDLNINLGAIRNYDYLWLIDDNGNRIFYFIIGKKKKNQKCSVILKCDVFQTYMFNYKIYDSFVERCHVKRWNSYSSPTMEIIDEGLPIGEYRYYGSEKIAKLNESYLISSTTPLGVLNGNSQGGGATEGGTVGQDTELGGNSGYTTLVIQEASFKKAPSQHGLRFIKGFEGFAQYGAYFNKESFKTAGYGITEKHNPDYYNRMKPFPMSESTASIALATIMTENFAKQLLSKLKYYGLKEEKMKQHHFDAMLSISMNMGVGGFSDTRLMKECIKVINGNLNPLIVKGLWSNTAITSAETGEVLAGLVKRREEEYKIFAERNYLCRPITVFDSNGKSVGILKNNNGSGYLPDIS